MRKPTSMFTMLFCAGIVSTTAALASSSEDANEINRLHQSGNSAQALQLAEKLLADRPKDAQLRFVKGMVLAETRRVGEAIDVFQALTVDFPELPEPYNNLAALQASRGDYERARVALEEALRNNPAYATAQENLGDVYAMLASRAYAKALTLEPANPQLPAKLALVRELFASKNHGAAPKALR